MSVCGWGWAGPPPMICLSGEHQIPEVTVWGRAFPGHKRWNSGQKYLSSCQNLEGLFSPLFLSGYCKIEVKCRCSVIILCLWGPIRVKTGKEAAKWPFQGASIKLNTGWCREESQHPSDNRRSCSTRLAPRCLTRVTGIHYDVVHSAPGIFWKWTWIHAEWQAEELLSTSVN